MKDKQQIIEAIEKDSDQLRFTISGARSFGIKPPEFDNDVIEAVKTGNVDFLKVTLQTGFESKVAIIEKNYHELKLKLKKHTIESRYLRIQRNLLSKYIDNNLAAELREALYNKLFDLSDNYLEEAVREEIQLERNMPERYSTFKPETRQHTIVKGQYFQYLSQHDILTDWPNIKAGQVLSNIHEKIAANDAIIKELESELTFIQRDMRSAQCEHGSILGQDRNTFYILLDNARNKIPITYHYDSKDREVIDNFLKHKVSPDLIDPLTGDSLLNLAILNNQPQVVELLLKRGADCLKTIIAGRSPLDLSSKSSNNSLFKMLTNNLSERSYHNTPEVESDAELKNILKELGSFGALDDAKKVVDNYGKTINKRRDMSIFFRIIKFYQFRLASREKEFAEYQQMLDIAYKDQDPHLFFKAVEKISEKASRGLRGLSELHDQLIKLKKKFIEEFDSHRFNEMKTQYIKNKLKSSSNSDLRSSNNESKENESLKEIVRRQSEQLQFHEIELKTMRDEVTKLKDHPKTVEQPKKSSSFFGL